MEKSKLNRRPIGSTTRYQAGVSGVYNNRKQPTLSNGHSTANELRDASSWHLPTISLGLAPVAVILLLFGGRPTLITICLAGIFAYIIDIVGFVEGSVLVLTGMFAGIFITLTYAARFIIGESIFNFPFIVTFGVALLYCFFCILLQFQSLLNEGDRFLSALHTWVIITMPSVCSAIITWFISIEIPALDIGICYSIVYFLYMLLLTTPKDTPKSMTFSIKKGLEGIGSNSASNTAIKQSKRIPVFDVPNQTLLLMYMLPVIVSMLLYIDLHHFRFKYESIFHEFIGITISMAFPCVLMSLCAEFQIEFYCDVIRNAKNSVSDARLIRRNDTIHKQYICKKLFGFGGLELLRICQLGSFCCLLLALHDHPVLDDIKAFAKWNKDVASLLIIIGCMSLLGAIVSARRCRSNNNRAKDEDAVLVTDVYVGVCSVVCTASFGLLLGMPVYVLPACIGGVLLFLEFYERSFDFKNVYSLYLAIIFVLCAGLSSCVVTLCFTQRTIWFLNYDLESHLFNGSFITMQLFSNVCAMMTCLAVVIPPLLSKSTNGNGVIRELTSENVGVGESFMSDTLGYIPESVKNSGNGSGGILDSSLSNSLSNAITYVFESTASILPTKFSSFSILYTLMCLLITFLELLIREQDWSGESTFISPVDVEVIYPAYLCIFTAVLLCGTVLQLSNSGIIEGKATVIVVFITQCCKMLHLLVTNELNTSNSHTSSSELVFVSMLLILSYMGPFLLHATAHSTDTKIEVREKTTDSNVQLAQEYGLWKPEIPSVLSVIYISLTLYATSWAQEHNIIGNILVFATLHTPSAMQVMAASVSFWCAYMALYMLIFYREHTTLRSIFLIVAVVLALVTVDALGPFSVIENPNRESMFPYVLTLHSRVSAHKWAGGFGGGDHSTPGVMAEGALSGDMELLSDHTSFYLFVSIIMAVCALTSIIPIKKPFVRLLYVIVFSITCGLTLVGYCFPLTIHSSGNADSHGIISISLFSVESLYCILSAFLATSIVFHTLSKSNAKSLSIGNVLLITWAIAGVCYFMYGYVYYNGNGIDGSAFTNGGIWVGVIIPTCIGISVSYMDIFVELTTLSPPTEQGPSNLSNIREKAAKMGNICAIIGIAYTYAACIFSTHLIRDLVIPCSSLLLLCTRKGYMWFGNHVSPLYNAMLFSCIYWSCSALYSILIFGYDSNEHGLGVGNVYLPLEYLENFSNGQSFQFGILRDEYVSIWHTNTRYHESASHWKPILNMILLMIPWIAILLSYYGKSTIIQSKANQSGNWLLNLLYSLEASHPHFIFTMSMLSLLSLICSQLWSIRLLGLTSFIWGNLSSSSAYSNRVESMKFSNRVI